MMTPIQAVMRGTIFVRYAAYISSGISFFLVLIPCFNYGWKIAPAFAIALATSASCWLAYRLVANSIWMVWAFTEVRDVHELKELAIKERVMAEQGSWPLWIQVLTASQKKQLAAQQWKFEQEDEYSGMAQLPPATQIYNSQSVSNVLLVGSLICTLLTLYLAMQALSTYRLSGIALIAALATAALSIILFTKFSCNSSKAPQIIISDAGISTSGNPLGVWSDIRSETVRYQYRKNIIITFLEYSIDGKQISVRIGAYNKSPAEILHLLRVYRKRSILAAN